jgi:hypothetical protein
MFVSWITDWTRLHVMVFILQRERCKNQFGITRTTWKSGVLHRRFHAEIDTITSFHMYKHKLYPVSFCVATQVIQYGVNVAIICIYPPQEGKAWEGGWNEVPPSQFCIIFNKYKTFSVLIYSYINTSGREMGKTRNYVETRRPEGGVFSHNFEFSHLFHFEFWNKNISNFQTKLIN